MKKIGMDIHKVGMIPAKADVEAQEKFLENELKPRIQEANAGADKPLACHWLMRVCHSLARR
ncbi:MAG: hypothetical protein QJT81_12805 [Candidatus Thiothrix putei]|uniref:Uncharacterized protein n=1 Tax=Candidatus Thiothrix putei TaxID=3080811 RepID=A0AA95KMD3_9GAMM|nr:MAG: hypothetical protein QJT81_12805 [Candidatus Thiothrix putei]